MTPEDSAHDKELLERYKRASDTKPAAPSEAVRAAILAEGRRVAQQHANSASQQPFDVSRRAANDSRWKITAFGTAGAALVAALLFAPRLWENARGPALQTSTVPLASNAPAAPPAIALESMAPAPPSAAAVPKAESVSPLQQDRQGSLAELAPAEQSPAEKKYAERAADTARSSATAAAGAPAARSNPGAPAAGYAQSEVSANRVRAARAKAAEPSGLLLAAASGDTLKVQALMDQGAALNERDDQGRTALMLAVIDGRREAVRLLLDRGADPNVADHSGRTPLQMARQANLQEIVTLLERSGARQDGGK
jgi:hypothetical protein